MQYVFAKKKKKKHARGYFALLSVVTKTRVCRYEYAYVSHVKLCMFSPRVSMKHSPDQMLSVCIVKSKNKNNNHTKNKNTQQPTPQLSC